MNPGNNVYPEPPQYGQPTGQPQYGQPAGPPHYGQPAGPPQYGQPAGPHGTTAVVVQQPGQFVVQGGPRPSDYLILSIVSVLFCWPMAICAIMYSCNSKSAFDAGDFIRAESQGRTARNIGIAAIILGIIIIVVAVAVPLAIAGAAVASVCSNSYVSC